MGEVFKILVIVVTFFRGGIMTSFAEETRPTKVPAVDDPLAETQEREVAFRPLGDLVLKKAYYQKVGERIFYLNGKVAQEELLKRGRPDGSTRLYYLSGMLFSEQPYEEGMLNGVVRFYKENGELLGESKFDHGTGVLRQFPLKSLMLEDMEVPYKNGRKHGIEGCTQRTGG